MYLRQEILRKLVYEYQKTHSREAFEGILKRVDWLVVYVVNNLRRRFFYYGNISFVELYQTAIVGVGEALLSVKKNEDGDKIVARIISYIKAAIKRTFKPPKEISGGGICEKYLESSSEEDMSRMIDIIDFCKVEIFNYLNPQEKELLYKRFFKSMTYVEISKTSDCKKGGVRLRVVKILKKLRFRLSKKDMEDLM